jgi:hypothetical protein
MNTQAFSPGARTSRQIGTQVPWLQVCRLCLMCIGLLLSMTACQLIPHSVTPTHTPVSYQSLCGVTNDQFGVMDEAGVQAFIEARQGRLLRPLSPDQYKDLEALGVTHYAWESDQADLVNVAYLRNGRLVRITWQYSKQGLTLGDVVAGLGAPDVLYQSTLFYEKVVYSFGLDYPGLGISVSAHGLGDVDKVLQQGKLVLPLTPNMQVDRVECYKPGPMEQVLREEFFLSEYSISVTLQSQVPWPGFGKPVIVDSP